GGTNTEKIPSFCPSNGARSAPASGAKRSSHLIAEHKHTITAHEHTISEHKRVIAEQQKQLSKCVATS
ncbi:MAG: hypothetical protein AB2813_07590, partial [Candidatus Sedimenticola endophacoides]